ncbi:MAG: hypothetical protein ACJ74W_25405 [Pyrinomonadaceae bacterium]
MYQSPVLLTIGISLIATGILSAFQVSDVWVLLVLLIGVGGGLGLVVWGGSQRHARRR